MKYRLTIFYFFTSFLLSFVLEANINRAEAKQIFKKGFFVAQDSAIARKRNILRQNEQAELKNNFSEQANKTKTFRIAMFLPLNLSDLDTSLDVRYGNNTIGLDYFQGAKIALDSLTSLGMMAEVDLFDTEKDSAKTNLQVFDLKPNTDLIIGPVFPEIMKPVIAWAQKMDIPIVLPLSPASVKGFKYNKAIQVTNSIENHAENMGAFAAQVDNASIIVLQTKQTSEQKITTPLTNYFKTNNITFNTAIGIAAIRPFLNISKNNIIIVGNTEAATLTTLFNALKSLTNSYKISIIGHPNWEKLEGLNFQGLQNLNWYSTSSYSIDKTDPETAAFIQKYKTTYNIAPSEYAVKGYAQMLYFGNLLWKYNKDFCKKLIIPSDNIYSKWSFEYNASSGYENKGLLLMKNDNYKWIEQ